LPRREEIKLSPDASYTYICSNNTIEGTQYTELPASAAPLVADMSSDIASVPWTFQVRADLCRAQKNLGPSGVTVVIVRKDLAERADKNLPSLLQYRTHIKEKSLYHTPPTFAVYVLGLVTEWIAGEGGLAGCRSATKPRPNFCITPSRTATASTVPVEKASRSQMNVVFRVAGGDEAVEKQFAKDAPPRA